MNKKVEIILGDYPNQISLDLIYNSISIALQYSIDDIRDIDKKNSNYSKTITLPGTKKNNNAFGSLFDVNSSFDLYNPNKKVNARIVVDSSPVLEGYLQLINVKKLNKADLQGNLISYEVVVFDDSIDFIQTVGDKEVRDLDFSSLNHTYGKTAIENAWNNHTFTDVYQYPMMDKITQGYQTEDFKPAFYHKALLLEVAKDSGYTLEGSFITNNTTYEKELISWDGNTPTITDSQALLREFSAGLTGGTTTLQTKDTNTYKSFSSNIQEQATNFDNITTPFFDNTGNYTFDLGTPILYSQWETSNTGKYNFEIKIRAGVSYFGRGIMRFSSGVVISNSSNDVKVRAVLRDADTGAFIPNGSRTTTLGKLNSLTSSSASDPKVTKSVEADATLIFSDVYLLEGQKVRVYLQLVNDIAGSSTDNFAWTTGTGSSITPETVTLNFYIKDTLSTGGTSSFSNEVVKVTNINDGDNLELNLYLPKDIKQKDILSDVIRRYNVYVRKHPTKAKTLILESRDDYYDNPTVLDWTQKKDYNSEDKIQFLSELQNKEILFTYKEANDIVASDGGKYNDSYNLSTGDIYGQKKISFDNDFVKGVKKIESIFSTTPLVYRGDKGNDVVVPSLNSLEGKRKSVLLYWGGLTTIQDENGNASTVDITFGTNPTLNSSVYPYGGHYNNPYTPTIDIHFGLVTYEYYGVLLNTITNGNLFNNYWANYINQISTGKLITSKFYLNETDINFIKDNLNSRIFIKDSYYIINKIVDYKLLEDGLTTVELSRIEQGSTFTPTISTPTINIAPSNQTLATQNNSTVGAFNTNPTNTLNSVNVLAIGDNNSVGSSSSAIVNGNNNIVGGDVKSVNVAGSNNTVQSGLKNVTEIRNRINVTRICTTAIGDLIIQSGQIIDMKINSTFTPIDTDDEQGSEGSIAFDTSYLYVKTSLGWGRISLDYSF